MTEPTDASPAHLGILGCGELGSHLLSQLADSSIAPLRKWQVTGITKTDSRHAQLRRQMDEQHQKQAPGTPSRFSLATTSESLPVFQHLIICVPPSTCQTPRDYLALIAYGLDHSAKQALFVSSSGVFAATDHAELCHEDDAVAWPSGIDSDFITRLEASSTPADEGGIGTRYQKLAHCIMDWVESDASLADSLLRKSATSGILLLCEALVLHAGGVVVRLAGLYSAAKGPHCVYQRMKESPMRPDGFVNLIHYSDAASLCLHALAYAARLQPYAHPECPARRVFLGCDLTPMERCQITRAMHPRPCCAFVGKDGPLGKRLTNPETRKTLAHWQPLYASFAEWAQTQQW